MNISQIHIFVAIVVLAIVAILLFFEGRNRREIRLTPLAGVALVFIFAGILLGENRLIGYGLMAFGVILAVIDMLMKRKAA
jgi:membrane-bound ClpP family serine protease